MKHLFLFSAILRQRALTLLFVAMLSGLSSCGGQTLNHTAKKLAQDTSVQNFEGNLTFNDVTLDQFDEQGRPVWKVKAQQAVYSKDKKTAQVQTPVGALFQDGKPIYNITALKGEIQQDGKQLFLKGQIVATDPRDGLVLRGSELEWRPKEDLLIVRNHLIGNHKQLQIVAQEARVFSRSSRVELRGQVVAIVTDPAMRVRTEHLIWQIREQKLNGDTGVQIDRYQNQTVTDRAAANQAEVDLKSRIATLRQNAQLALVDPPLQVASNDLNWNLNAQTVVADQPVRMVQRQHNLTVTADRGRMDLQQKIVYLDSNVYGVGQRGQSLNATHLIWYLPNQLVDAEGNVVYHQAEPPASFVGQKAVGKLQDQSIVVSGGISGSRVVTEIVP